MLSGTERLGAPLEGAAAADLYQRQEARPAAPVRLLHGAADESLHGAAHASRFTVPLTGRCALCAQMESLQMRVRSERFELQRAPPRPHPAAPCAVGCWE